jgi:hypothetical protein
MASVMKRRLLEALNREDGISLDAAIEKLDLCRLKA